MSAPLSPERLSELREALEAAPRGPWTWRTFGGPLMLVTRHGGARVVVSGDPWGAINVRDEHGILVPITEDHPVAKLVEVVPDLLAAYEEQRGEIERLRAVVAEVEPMVREF